MKHLLNEMNTGAVGAGGGGGKLIHVKQTEGGVPPFFSAEGFGVCERVGLGAAAVHGP